MSIRQTRETRDRVRDVAKSRTADRDVVTKRTRALVRFEGGAGRLIHDESRDEFFVAHDGQARGEKWNASITVGRAVYGVCHHRQFTLARDARLFTDYS